MSFARRLHRKLTKKVLTKALDTFAPPVIASMTLGDCCVASLCQRRNRDRVIVIDAGEPCEECLVEMKRLCYDGFAKSIVFSPSDEFSPPRAPKKPSESRAANRRVRRRPT